MKRTLAVLMLLLVVAVAYPQDMINMGIANTAIKAYLVSTHTNFTSSTADTSGYITVPVIGSPLLGSYCAVIFVSTDSIQMTLNILGYNRPIGTFTKAAYVDSITVLGGGGTDWNATTPKVKVVVIKGQGVDRFPGCTDFKIGFNGLSTMGTTSGRTLKAYLMWVR